MVRRVRDRGKTLFQYLPLPVRKLKFWRANATSGRS